MKDNKTQLNTLWFIIEDLNLVTHQSEKLGGNNFDNREVQFARNFI